MKDWKNYVISLIIVFILSITQPSLADQGIVTKNLESFHVGQRVTWLYKARPNSKTIQQIPGEVVKLGEKQIQIKVKKNNHEFVKRWVNRDKLLKANS